MAGRRLLRCHPWGGAGYDPVPNEVEGASTETERNDRDRTSWIWLFLFAGICLSSGFVITGCASGPENNNVPSKDDDPYSVSNEVYEKQKPKLRKAFFRMKRAILNGNLEALQDLWIRRSGDPYTIQELSRIYNRNGKEMADQIREADIVEQPSIDVSIPKQGVRKQHPNAKYMGSVPFRNSFGDPKQFRALYLENSWKFIITFNTSKRGRNERKTKRRKQNKD